MIEKVFHSLMVMNDFWIIKHNKYFHLRDLIKPKHKLFELISLRQFVLSTSFRDIS